MQISHTGLGLVKDSEGLRKQAYQDVVGVWTIGYGTIHIDGKPVEPGMTCSEPQASLWLEADMSSVQTMLNQTVRVPLKQGMFDALCSLGYNIGPAALRNSTLIHMLNLGDYTGASKQFLRWDMAGGKHVPGLTARRLREQSLFEQ